MTNLELYNAVYQVLRASGVPPASKSNAAIAEAVIQYRKNPAAAYGQWTSELLPAVGKVLSLKPSAVEQLIKRALEECYRVDECAMLCGMLGVPKGKFRVRNFIVALSDSIRG